MKISVASLLFIAVFSFPNRILLGQEIYNDVRFERISVNDGLSQSAVQCIEKDKYGYMWFGTRSGLSKYDGYGFVNYVSNPRDSTSLSNSSIYSLKNSENGDLWIGTSHGLNLFERSTERFYSFEFSGLNNNNIFQIEHFGSDSLLLGTQRGVYIFDTRSKNLSRAERFAILDTQQIYSLLVQNNRILFGTDNGLYSISDIQSEHILDLEVRSLFEDENESIWVGTSPKKLLRLSPNLNEITELETRNKAYYVASIQRDNSGNIIVGGGSLDIYNERGDLLKVFQHQPSKSNSLSRDNILAVYCDSQNIIWVGTNGYGLNKYDPNITKVHLISNSSESAGRLRSDYVTSIYSDDNSDIIIGTTNGLHLYNRSKDSISTINSSSIYSLYASNDILYAASMTYYLQSFSMPSMQPIKSLRFQEIRGPRAMVDDENGNLWIGGETGLLKYFPNNDELEVYLTRPSDIVFQTSDWITALSKDKNALLVGTSQGLYRFNTVSKEYHKISGETYLDPIKNSYIKCINHFSNGMIWIGTWGDGLFKWDREKLTLTQYLKEDGLPDDVIYSVLEDKSGMIWMSTNNGISRYDLTNDYFFNVDYSYGLQSNEFNTGAYFKGNEDYLYFGGIHGLNFFQPGDFKKNLNIPDTYISGINVNNIQTTGAELSETESMAIMDLQKIELPYNRNMLKLDFLSTNHTIPLNNQYAFYMESLEKDWNYEEKVRYANYSSIPPGKYIFKVKSSNNDGIWDETPVQLQIIIQPPFWQEWWFRVLIIVFTLSSIWYLYRARVKYLKINQIKLQELVTTRTSELERSLTALRKAQKQLVRSEKMASLGLLSSGIGHEINNPLNFIQNGARGLEAELKEQGVESADQIKPFLEIINTGVKRASKIVKSLSHFSRHGKGLDEQCDIHDILNNCVVILESKLKNRVEIIADYWKEKIFVIGNEGKLHQAFLNILSNAEQAIEDQGTITIKTQIIDKMLHATISDSGVGIAPDHLKNISEPFFTTKGTGEGVGLGLFITFSIIDEHNGEILVNSSLNLGTEVKVKLNMPKNVKVK